MGHSFSSSLYHVVFATKGRRRLLTSELRLRLFPYLGGIARKNKIGALSIGGIEDHVHLLLSLPSTLEISRAVKIIKANSSKWIHDTCAELRDFRWQEGYGAFTIGISDIDRTRKYIERQAEHHSRITFEEEFTAILKKHEMDWQHPHLWD